MYTNDQLMTALQNADAAGDVEAAREIARLIQQGQQQDPFAALYQPTAPAAPQEPAPQPEPEGDGFLRSVADVPLKFGQGAVMGVRMLADAFGADSDVSESLRGAENYLADLMSAGSKQDSAEVARIMDEAKDKGVYDQVIAGLEAFTVAPIDTVSNALGTAAPIIAGTVLATVTGGVPLGVATGLGLGAGTGAGVVKGAIYETVKEELVNAGVPENIAEERAVKAQEYGGENLDQILLGAGVTSIGAITGLEKTGVKAVLQNITKKLAAKQAAEETAETAVEQGVLKRAAKSAAAESLTEGLQGGQEQYARNLALQREGIDTPLTRGIFAAGTLESLAGGITAGTLEAVTGGESQQDLEDGAAQANQQALDDLDREIQTIETRQAGEQVTDDAEPPAPVEPERPVSEFEEVTDVSRPEQPPVEPSVSAPDGRVGAEPVAAPTTEAKPRGMDVPPSSVDDVGVGEAGVSAPLDEEAKPAGRKKTITETSAEGVVTTRTEDVPELTGLDTPINDIEDGKIVPKSARQILAEQQRVKQEQDKRRERLNDPKKLAEYAEETGQTVEEAQALLEQNTVDNLAREGELDDIVDRPEFKELQAEEKTKASKIKFKDTTEAEPAPVSKPSIVESIFDNLRQIQDRTTASEFKNLSNDALDVARGIEDDFESTPEDLATIQLNAQAAIANGQGVIEAYTQAAAELKAANELNELTPEQREQVESQRAKEAQDINSLRTAIAKLEAKIGSDVTAERILEPLLTGIPVKERLDIIKKILNLATRGKNAEGIQYSEFVPTQSIQRAAADPKIARLVEAQRTLLKEQERAEIDAARAAGESVYEVLKRRAMAARQLASMSRAVELEAGGEVLTETEKNRAKNRRSADRLAQLEQAKQVIAEEPQEGFYTPSAIRDNKKLPEDERIDPREKQRLDNIKARKESLLRANADRKRQNERPLTVDEINRFAEQEFALTPAERNAEDAAFRARRRAAIITSLSTLQELYQKGKPVEAQHKSVRIALEVLEHPSVTRSEIVSALEEVEQQTSESIFNQMSAHAMAVSRLAGDVATEGLLNVTTAQEAFAYVKANGSRFQKFVADRLKPFLKGVKVVIVNDVNQDITDPIALLHYKAMGDNPPAGLFTNKTIYLTNRTGAGVNGVNMEVLIHEAFHAATIDKLYLYTNPKTRGRLDEASLKAIEDINRIMTMTYETYQRRRAAGRVNEEVVALVEQFEALTDINEFISYGLSNPYMQAFLLEVSAKFSASEKENKGILTRFFDAIRRLFKFQQREMDALSALLTSTNNLLTATDLNIPPSELAAMAKKRKVVQKAENRIKRSTQATEANADISTLVAETRSFEDAKGLLGSIIDAASTAIFRPILAALTTDQITQISSSLLPQVKRINKAVADMQGKRMRMLRALSDKVPQWIEFNRKFPKEKGAYILADVMHEATLEGADPSVYATMGLFLQNDPVTKALQKRLKDPKLNNRQRGQIKRQIEDRRAIVEGVYAKWDQLGEIGNGEGQKIYVMAKESYRAMRDEHMRILIKKIQEADIAEEDKNRLLAQIEKAYADEHELDVYFPLMRYGQFWVRVAKPGASTGEYYMFESAIARNQFLKTRYKEMQADGETRSLSDLHADEQLSWGDSVYNIRDDFLRETTSDGSPSMLRSIYDVLDTVENQQQQQASGTAIAPPDQLDIKKIKDDLYQLYLMTLPDRDIRKKWIRRQGKPGYTKDVLRNFITSQHTAANQLTRLEYSGEIQNAISEADEYIRRVEGVSEKGLETKTKRQAVLKEMILRTDDALSPTQNDEFGLDRLATLGNQTVFYYMLTSPKSALVQATQLPIVGIPVLQSRYGIAKTMKIIGRYSNLFNKLGTVKRNPDGTIRTRWGAPSINDSKYAATKPHLRKAFEIAMDRDLFMSTYAGDLQARSKVPSARYEGTMSRAGRSTLEFMGGAFHHIERITREIMYMTSFELEFDKLRAAGVSEEEAIQRAADTAEEITKESLFNYTQYNKPRFMKRGAFKLGTQFLTYPMQMTWFLTNNFFKMLPFLNKAEKQEAATKFFGTLGMTFAFGGATSLGMGLISYSSMMGIAEGMREAFRGEGDDDDWPEKGPLGKRNLDLWFREDFLPEYFGPGSSIAKFLGLTDEEAKTLQRAVEMGPISAYTDMNIGASTSLDGLWFRDNLRSDTYEGAFQEFFFKYASGPFGGMISQIGSAFDEFEAGRYNRGFEKMLPAFFRGAAKAVRVEDEGERTKQGNIIKAAEWYTTGKLIGMAGGFQSTEVAEIQKANFAAKEMVVKLEKERTKLLQKLDRSMQVYQNNPSTDTEDDVDAAFEAIFEFNEKNAFMGIDDKSIERSLKGRAKSRAGAYQGLVVSPQLAPFVYPLVESSRDQ
jgi:hypothetical protein